MNTNYKKPLGKYLGETLGVEYSFTEWSGTNSLPVAIRDAYEFAELGLFGKRFLLMKEAIPGEMTPAAVAKQLKWSEEKTGLKAIFGAEFIASFNRKRLIEHKVPFVVPGNQLYLPDLGIDLREHLKKQRTQQEKLLPSAQLILLLHLHDRIGPDGWTATSLAEKLGHSKMTMSRAIEQLENAGLVEVVPEGRQKRIHFLGDRKELWERALPYLRSPVQNRVYLEHAMPTVGPLAGLSALSELTMLVGPKAQVRAVTSAGWKTIQKEATVQIIPEASFDLAGMELEIWKYDPRKLSESGLVDPLSLFLSIENERDERVEAALEQLIEEMQW